MTVPTPEQLTRLRQRPHRTKLQMAVYQPNTVLAAQIDMPAIAKGEREITISVLAGDVWSVARGMTCYIGTTPNERYERLRAISCTPTTITLAENDLNWVDGLYLTVVNFFEPWAVFPRITLSDQNVPSFYKDYDIVYTNQNEIFDPVVNMGPPAAKFLTTTPTGTFARLWYNSSGTYDPSNDSIPTGYAWSFEGGYPTATYGPDPGYIEYTGGGHFLTSLTVTSDFGKTFTGRRHVMILNELGDGSYPPITHWGFSSMEGSRDQGGYSLRLWVREEADFTKIADGALIVIFSDDSEGPFDGKVGGNAENRSETFFVGYVETDSISINSFTNRLEFRAESITGTLKKMATFSATLEDVEDAATWNEMTALTVDKSLVHYLRWHTTVLSICDFAPMGNGVPVEYIDFERGNIYDAVNNIAASTLIGTVCADRQGKVWAEIDINVVPTGSSRSLNTVMALTRQDWRSNLDIRVVHDPVLSYLEMGGIAYSGQSTTGTSVPFLAGAPGDAPSYWGSLERVSGLVLEGQVPLNELVGLAWARANATFPTLTIPVAGDYRVFDIAPQERVVVSLEPEDNYRGFTWDLKPFVPHAIRYTYNSAQQSLMMEIEAREETDGPPGEKVEIPVDPPFDTFDLPAWELPPFTLPPIPVIPPLEAPPTTGGTVYVVYGSAIARSRNFFDASPNWALVSNVSSITGITGIWGMVLDPADPINSAIIWGTNGATNPCILKTANLDAVAPTWTLTFGYAEMVSLLGGTSTADSSIQHVKPWINGRLWTAAGQGPKNCGVGEHCPKFVRSFDGGNSWGDEHHVGITLNYGNPMVAQPTSYGGGTIYAGGQFRLWKSIDAGVNWTLKQSNPPGYWVPVQMPHPGGSSGEIIYAVRTVSFVPERHRLAVSTDGGTTFTNLPLTYNGYGDWAPFVGGGVLGNVNECFHIHPVTGVGYGMLASNQAGYSIFAALSTTWVTLWEFNDQVYPYAVHESDDSYHYALGPGVTTPNILGSTDGGVTWVSKVGDFTTAVMSFAAAGSRTSINPVGVI